MIHSCMQKYGAALVSLGLALFLLWGMLAPGYILSYDMIWTPELSFGWSVDTPNNTFLLRVFLYGLSVLLPAWLVQKLLLIVLFFLLFFVPYRFLPFISGVAPRAFAAGVYALNPFVYSRLLAGQWFHLLGYALLPLLLATLLPLSARPNWRGALRLVLVLTGIGLCSVHFLYLAVMVSVFWLSAGSIRSWYRGETREARNSIRVLIMAILGFIVVNAYWIMPAFARIAPLEARFDETHFAAFAAAANGTVPVMVNVAALGGFWGEDLVWGYYFAWPQRETGFWIAATCIGLAIVGGIGQLLRKRETRFSAALLLILGGAAYVAALGVAETPFRSLNMLLYEHIPFWNGLRDSHKIVGLLALSYAVFAGAGVDALLSWVRRRNVGLESFLAIVILVVPVMYGSHLWGGARGQLAPVWYPDAWFEAKVMIDALPSNANVLVLPWHMYFSLDFAANRITANPTSVFFGPEHIIAGRSVEIGQIYDQEIDPEYRGLDWFIRTAEALPREALVAGLRERGITHILIVANPAVPYSERGLTQWTEYSTEIGHLPGPDSGKNWEDMLAESAVPTLSTPTLKMLKMLDK